MSAAVKQWLIPTIFVLWLFFVLASFFAVQKPFDTTTALALTRSSLNLLTAAWLGCLGLGLGSWLLARLVGPELTLAERLILGPGLGLGLLGLLGLGLGLVGLLQPWAAYSLSLGLTLGLIPQFKRLAVQIRSWRPANRPNRWMTVYLAIIATLALLLALLPPSDWDGLFYHLTGPKLHLQAGQLVNDVDVPHFNFPALMEMLFAWAMLLRGDVAATLLHTGFGGLLAGLVYLTGSRLLGQRSGWPAVLVLASMPMLGTLAAWAYNDLALAFYQLASLYALARWLTVGPRESTAGRWLVLSGLLAGLAMGLKYTSFVTPVTITGLLLYHSLRSTPGSGSPQGRPAWLTNLALFALPALLLALPWYAKNWFFTGNPVYPFLYGLFGGHYWDSFRADWYAAAGSGVGWELSTLLSLPWLLTLGVRDANYWDGRTGSLLLLFLPLVLAWGIIRAWRGSTHPQAKTIGLLLIYVGVHFGFWSLGVIWSQALWQSRLLLPGLAGLAPLAGWAWSQLERLDRPHFSLSGFVNIAIGLTLTLTIIDVGLLALKIDPLPYLVGLEQEPAYLTRRLGAHYGAMQTINETLPPEATVVFLWEPRSYYCQRDCRPDSILDEFPHLVHQYGSAEAIAAQWQQAGVSHILLHRAGLQFVLNEQPGVIDQTVLAELEERYLHQMSDVVGAYQLYRLEAGP